MPFDTEEEVVEDPDEDEKEVAEGEGPSKRDARETVHCITHFHSPRSDKAQGWLAQEWLPHRQDYLDELLRGEGMGDADKTLSCKACATGHDRPAKYRCQDCFSNELLCQQCVVDRHEFLPLHRLLVSQPLICFDSLLIQIVLVRKFFPQGITVQSWSSRISWTWRTPLSRGARNCRWIHGGWYKRPTYN